MTDEEMKNKYGDFITKISEILGLGRPVDILKLCATTDLFFQPLEKRITELKAQNKELQCCANCNNSYGGEEEPYHDCGYCHAMQCICKLKLEEHTSDIYRMWEDKCERWEMKVN